MNTASTFNCFGLVIHGYDLNHIRTYLQTRAADHQKTWIVTANPEILLYAKQSPEYWEVLHQADLRIVDGKGLQLAGRLKKARAERVTGVELAEAVADLCAKNNWSLALIGGGEGVADKAAWFLRKQWPGLKVYAENGGSISQQGMADEEAEKAVIRLAEYEPDVILAAYGHPKQEFWINRYASNFPKTKLFMGVGGTFDFWSGQAKRAPRWLRVLGLEWCWRLMIQPSRWRRIYRAVIAFPWAVIRDKSS